jgi:hypothetical protein
MKQKIPVNIRKLPYSSHIYKRLSVCTTCNSVSPVTNEVCTRCKRSNTRIPILTYIDKWHALKLFRNLLLLLIMGGISVIFASTPFQLSLITIAGPAALILMLIVHPYRYKLRKRIYLQEMLFNKKKQIERSLTYEHDCSIRELEDENILEGYERLRDLGKFNQTDEIKEQQIRCLNQFVITEDVARESSRFLIPSGFSKTYVQFLVQVLKVAPYQLSPSVINYVMRYRTQIEEMPSGPQVMFVIVTRATLSMKFLVKFEATICDYLDQLSRDDFLKLCKTLSQLEKHELPDLTLRAQNIYKSKYFYDTDFKGLLQR